MFKILSGSGHRLLLVQEYTSDYTSRFEDQEETDISTSFRKF